MLYDKIKFDEALGSQYEGEIARVCSEGRGLAMQVRASVSSGKLMAKAEARFADRAHKTNEERLAYYRSHGLDRCDDYPGGDAAFEADVLSRKYHDEDGIWWEHGRKDVYVIARMEDGRFRFTPEFTRYGYSLIVYKAILDNCGQSGFDLR